MTPSPSFGHRLIQIFNRYLEPGGEEVWVKNLENSFSVPTCYFESADWTGAKAPPAWSQALRMIRNPDALRKLRQFQKREQAEAWIVQNAFPTGSIAIYREAERQRIPILQYVHNFRPFCISGYLRPPDLEDIGHWRKMFLRDIKRAAWRNSRIQTLWFATVLTIGHVLGSFDSITLWIAVSDFMRDQFIRAGVPQDKIFTLRHFWRPAADLNTTTDQDYYLSITRLVPLKGILVLLDVWDRIFQEKAKTGPKLVIVGQGALEDVVKQRAAVNPLVDYRGSVPVEMKRRLLSGMRALIAPSLCLESLGLVAYEAYDYAKPVLAAHAGGLAEIVLNDRTGFVHDPGDTDTLLNHIAILESDPAKRRELGQNGRQWLLTYADENQWRKRFAELLEVAIAAKK